MLEYQLFRYAIVGGIAFIIDTGTLFLMTEFFHIHYLVSAAAAFIAGLITNYLLSINWVFEHHTCQSRNQEFIVFAAIGILGLGMNELFIWFFTEKAGLYYVLSKVLSTGLVFLWNFYARKIILFRQQTAGR